MQKEINQIIGVRVGDIQLVQELTVIRKLGNKGEGFSYQYCKFVKEGNRTNEEITKLFNEVIKSRDKVINKEVA